MKNYSKLDSEIISSFLFHPRKGDVPSKGLDIKISLENAFLGAKFFESGKKNPIILFFHGNGEIVSDYNDIGEMYLDRGINFFAVDYRGYGVSTGDPKASLMMEDAGVVFKYFVDFCKDKGINGKKFVMGRSLGSASAIEIAKDNPDEIDGLIVESGFAYTVPLLRLLGIGGIKMDENEGFDNLEKIKKYNKPLLVIHAENDHIIPFTDGEDLYQSSPSKNKKLVKIDMADHNTIFYYGISRYMNEVSDFVG